MKKTICMIFLLAFMFTACQITHEEIASDVEPIQTSTPTTRPSQTPAPSNTPIPSDTPEPTLTSTPSPTITPSHTPTPTKTPVPTATPTATPFAFNNEIIDALVEQGYQQAPLLRFESPVESHTFFSNQGQFGNMQFGGPNLAASNHPFERSITFPDGNTYLYIQYELASQDGFFSSDSCHLMFFKTTDEETLLIADINISDLSGQVAEINAPLFCLPYEWGDFNENGKPDIPVTFLWANNYTGGEVHIFEVIADDTVIDLTSNLPGPVNYWLFDPRYPDQMVVDLQWASHDCLYPHSPFSFWIFGWDGEKFADWTANGTLDFSNAISIWEGWLDSGYPFEPDIQIGAMVSILLMYDKMGQRDIGWEKFMEFADESNWPDSSPEALAWLRDDVAHFTQQYNAGLPFTPNGYNCGN
ncbi:hypothetical protein [Candidatus Leptofilum sp.]|uniref:hypothetical protein n=1 Tax=Candidatus Leptofilum sp. TaxID=3241576 RepID=UPI003B596905